ncbi:NTF2-like N-terminal transpeptidase domain-containing protein, partial [Streptomyces scabiei]|uniref:DUF7059 domain-containing protein n=1 Tax=Streptomyces scabiei TaxID=1930 RepID=UPI0039F0EB05
MSNASLSPLPSADRPDVTARLRDALLGASFTADGLLELLGAPAYAALSRSETVPALRATRGDTPLELLVRLFLLQQPVPRARVADVLPVDACLESGWLDRAGDDEVAATVDVRPYGGADGEDTARTKSAAAEEKVKSGPLTAAEVTSTAQRFLTAWQRGDVAGAAAATDDAEAAKALLTGYTKDARIKDATFTAGTPAGEKVPFSVKATVAYGKATEPLAYDSALTVVRRDGDGEPRVDWHAAVVHPELRDGDKLVTGKAGDPPVKALDRDGAEITA